MSDELDPRLQALYRQMPKEEPSAAVDKVILDAAGRPVPRGQAWLLSFGAAASVVLVSSLVIYLQTRSPEALREAVTPTVAASPSPPAAPVVAVVPPVADSAVPEAEMAARRSAELARLRAEMALQQPREASTEAKIAPPPDLPVVRLSPPGGIANRQEAMAGGSAPDSMAGERMAPAAAAPLQARPEMAAAGKLKSMADDNPARAGIASVLMEGVSLGMHREDLAALGWGCAQAVCTREITDPRQPDYWGMNTVGATQRVQFINEAVAAMTLSQSGVPLNNVKLSLERIGKPAEQACTFGAVGDLIVSRLAGRMLLNLWQEGDVTTLRVCLAK
jgi:hypothetical protein